jgi:aspergillopepsin I
MTASAMRVILLGSLLLVEGQPIKQVRFTLDTFAPHRQLNGPAALRDAYLKFGVTVPEFIQQRSRQHANANESVSGSTEAIPDANDIKYASPVRIGGETLHLNFDTASSDLWVLSEHLTEKQCEGRHVYMPSKTDASILNGSSWRISYADGSAAAGIVYADHVDIGGATVTSQAVEAATSVSSRFSSDLHCDGILGFGFGTRNSVIPKKQQTWFERVKGALTEQVFTTTLKHNGSGTWDFGFIDHERYAGTLAYVTADTSRGYWEVPITGYYIDTPGLTFQAIVDSALPAIVDTATTLMLLPSSLVQDYYTHVRGASHNITEGGYVFPCSAKLPDMTLEVDHAIKLRIPGSSLSRGRSLVQGSTACFGGLQNGSGSMNILGDVFLKSHFVVFESKDNRLPRLGFAKQKEY